MNKSQLIAAVASKTGHTKKDVAEISDAITNTIQDTLASGGEVSLQGFGTFKRTFKPARDGRHPQTGEPIRIAESWSVRFAPSSGLKAAAKSQASPVSAVA